MLTVNHAGSSVEADLAAGRFLCPGCRGMLRPWGWARRRLVRHGTGPGRRSVPVRPRRARCAGCARTHVLLGVGLAGRRADTAAVIAAAIEAKAAGGKGHRPIAVWLGRPASTVRGWLRAFSSAASAITTVFTSLVHRDGADAAGLWPAPAPTATAAALAAVAAYARVVADRFAVVTVPWQIAGLAVVGPFFFSAGWWGQARQHELALMPPAVGGKGG